MVKKESKFNFSNKLAYTLIAIFSIIFIGVGVYAVSAGVTPNPGHNIQTISAPNSCASGQYLEYIANTNSGGVGACDGQVGAVAGTAGCWVCATPSSGTTLPTCATGQFVVKTSSTNWGCTPTCTSGSYLQYSSLGWLCATPSTGTTLPTCTSGQTLSWSGTAWTCATPATSSTTAVTVDGVDVYKEVTGAGAVCPAGYTVIRKYYPSQTCTGSYGCSGSCTTTTLGWISPSNDTSSDSSFSPRCIYNDMNAGHTGCADTFCFSGVGMGSTYWTKIICVLIK